MTPPLRPPDDRIALGTVGPAANGISILARRLAAAARAHGFSGTVLDDPDPGRLIEFARRLPPSVRLLHLHVSDWLFADAGADPDAVPAALVAELTRREVRLALTLHDVPQSSDGPALVHRRSATYRQWARSAADLIVSSEHERSLLREVAGLPVEAVGVVPLPIDPLPIDREPVDREPVDPRRTGSLPVRPGAGGAPPRSGPTVAVFGFLYPGKGHRELLDELTGVGPGLTVLAIGQPSHRHPDLPAELTEFARSRDIAFRIAGFVPDADLAGYLRGPVIPVAPQTRISASASLNAWIGAGRRPLVAAGRYAAELAARLPGAVRLYPPDGLRDEVRRAIDDPARTWLPPGLAVGPTTAAVAASYLSRFRRLIDGP